MRPLCLWIGALGIGILAGCSKSVADKFADKTTAEWGKMLQSEKRADCDLGLSAAIGMGPKAAPLVPTILGVNRDGVHWIKPLAKAIGNDALPHVVEATKSPDPKTRVCAIAWMASMTPPPAELDTCYAAALSDPDTAVRDAALFELRANPPKKITFGAALEKLLDSPDAWTRSSAALALATGDPRRSPAKTSRALIAGFSEESTSADFSDRHGEILPLFAAMCPEAIPAISAKDDSAYTWGALRACGPAAATEMAQLLKSGKYSSPSSGFELAAFGPAAKKAAPTLLEIVNDSSHHTLVVNVAIIALAGIDPRMGEALILQRLAGSTNGANQYVLIDALAISGSDKALDAAVKNKNTMALTRLASKMPEKVEPILREYAASCKDFHTADLVLPFAPDEPNVYRVLLKELGAKPGQQSSSFDALDRAVKLKGNVALAMIRKLTGDPDKSVQFKAAYATLHFEPSNVEVARILVPNIPRTWHEVLRYQEPIARPEAASTVSVLIEQLERDRDANVIACQLRTIGKMGPNAKDAADKVRPYLENPDSSLRYLAAAALANIEPGNKDSGPILKSLIETRSVGTQLGILKQILDAEKGRTQNAFPVIEIAETLYSFDLELAVRSGICHPAFGIPRADLHLNAAIAPGR